MERFISLDFETTGLNLKEGDVPFAAFLHDEEKGPFHFVWPVNAFTRQAKVSKADLSAIRLLLKDRTLVFHNAKFDLQCMQLLGLPFPRVYHDTYTASHVCCNTDPHGLKELADKYLGYQMVAGEKALKKVTIRARLRAKQQGIPYRLNEVEADYWLLPCYGQQLGLGAYESLEFFNYGSLDAEATLHLWFLFKEIMEAENLWPIYQREMRLQPVIRGMENNGVTVKTSNIDSMIREFESKVKEVHAQITRSYPRLNPNSPTQLIELFQKYDPEIDTTEKETLLSLEEGHRSPAVRKLAKQLLTYRGASKGIDYLKQYKRAQDGILYPQYNQNGTTTTRFSCKHPNSQNVAKKAAMPLRRAFGPRSGRHWYCFDYQQLQIRVFAHLANDEEILSRLEAGEDFHTIVACRIFNTKPDQVTSEQRRIAKNVNFGILFGAGPSKIDRTAGIPGLYRSFRQQFPAIDRFMRSTEGEIKSRNYVETAFGYRLYPRGGSTHVGVNYKVQGTEGDIVKNAMIDVQSYLDDLGDSSFITLQVHDELVLDTPEDWDFGFVDDIAYIMERAGKRLGFNTPVEASVVKDTWASPEPIHF